VDDPAALANCAGQQIDERPASPVDIDVTRLAAEAGDLQRYPPVECGFRIEEGHAESLKLLGTHDEVGQYRSEGRLDPLTLEEVVHEARRRPLRLAQERQQLGVHQ